MHSREDPAMHLILFAFVAALLALEAPCSFAFMDDMEELQGKTIVYAGEFEEVSCPINGKYNCLTWPTTLLKSKSGREVCVAPTGYVRCSYRCKALIAVDERSTRHLFIVDSSGDMKRTSFEAFQCPSMY